MAVTPDDILQPVGLIEAEWFPMEGTAAEVSQALTQRLEEYIEQGEAKAFAITDTDDNLAAVKAWATYRALMAIYLSSAKNPTSQSHEAAGSASWTKDQREVFKRMADEQLGIFNALVPTPDVVQRRVPPTSTTTHIFGW